MNHSRASHSALRSHIAPHATTPKPTPRRTTRRRPSIPTAHPITTPARGLAFKLDDDSSEIPIAPPAASKKRRDDGEGGFGQSFESKPRSSSRFTTRRDPPSQIPSFDDPKPSGDRPQRTERRSFGDGSGDRGFGGDRYNNSDRPMGGRAHGGFERSRDGTDRPVGGRAHGGYHRNTDENNNNRPDRPMGSRAHGGYHRNPQNGDSNTRPRGPGGPISPESRLFQNKKSPHGQQQQRTTNADGDIPSTPGEGGDDGASIPLRERTRKGMGIVGRVREIDAATFRFNNPRMQQLFELQPTRLRPQDLFLLVKVAPPVVVAKQLDFFQPQINQLLDGEKGLMHVAAQCITPDLARELLARGASINAPDALGNTPLHLAVKVGCSETVKFLIAHGADLHNINPLTNQTPLMLAATSDHRNSMVPHLLQGGASVDQQNNAGQTALMYATSFGTRAAISALYRFGANIDLVDEEGLNAYEHSKRHQDKDMPRAVEACFRGEVILTKRLPDETDAQYDERLTIEKQQLEDAAAISSSVFDHIGRLRAEHIVNIWKAVQASPIYRKTGLFPESVEIVVLKHQNQQRFFTAHDDLDGGRIKALLQDQDVLGDDNMDFAGGYVVSQPTLADAPTSATTTTAPLGGGLSFFSSHDDELDKNRTAQVRDTKVDEQPLRGIEKTILPDTPTASGGAGTGTTDIAAATLDAIPTFSLRQLDPFSDMRSKKIADPFRAPTPPKPRVRTIASAQKLAPAAAATTPPRQEEAEDPFAGKSTFDPLLSAPPPIVDEDISTLTPATIALSPEEQAKKEQESLEAIAHYDLLYAESSNTGHNRSSKTYLVTTMTIKNPHNILLQNRFSKMLNRDARRDLERNGHQLDQFTTKLGGEDVMQTTYNQRTWHTLLKRTVMNEDKQVGEIADPTVAQAAEGKIKSRFVKDKDGVVLDPRRRVLKDDEFKHVLKQSGSTATMKMTDFVTKSAMDDKAWKEKTIQLKTTHQQIRSADRRLKKLESGEAITTERYRGGRQGLDKNANKPQQWASVQDEKEKSTAAYKTKSQTFALDSSLDLHLNKIDDAVLSAAALIDDIEGKGRVIPLKETVKLEKEEAQERNMRKNIRTTFTDQDLDIHNPYRVLGKESDVKQKRREEIEQARQYHGKDYQARSEKYQKRQEELVSQQHQQIQRVAAKIKADASRIYGDREEDMISMDITREEIADEVVQGRHGVKLFGKNDRDHILGDIIPGESERVVYDKKHYNKVAGREKYFEKERQKEMAAQQPQQKKSWKPSENNPQHRFLQKPATPQFEGAKDNAV